MRKCCLLVLILMYILSSCSNKENLKPSPDSLLAAAAINNIDSIKSAYEEKNRDALKEYLDPVVADGFLKYFPFEKSEITITAKLVKIKTSIVVIKTGWRGTWTTRDGNKNERGIADFIFDRNSMKLIKVDLDNPFLFPWIYARQDDNKAVYAPPESPESEEKIDQRQTITKDIERQAQESAEQATSLRKVDDVEEEAAEEHVKLKEKKKGRNVWSETHSAS